MTAKAENTHNKKMKKADFVLTAKRGWMAGLFYVCVFWRFNSSMDLISQQ